MWLPVHAVSKKLRCICRLGCDLVGALGIFLGIKFRRPVKEWGRCQIGESLDLGNIRDVRPRGNLLFFSFILSLSSKSHMLAMVKPTIQVSLAAMVVEEVAHAAKCLWQRINQPWFSTGSSGRLDDIKMKKSILRTSLRSAAVGADYPQTKTLRLWSAPILESESKRTTNFSKILKKVHTVGLPKYLICSWQFAQTFYPPQQLSDHDKQQLFAFTQPCLESKIAVVGLYMLLACILFSWPLDRVGWMVYLAGPPSRKHGRLCRPEYTQTSFNVGEQNFGSRRNQNQHKFLLCGIFGHAWCSFTKLDWSWRARTLVSLISASESADHIHVSKQTTAWRFSF